MVINDISDEGLTSSAPSVTHCAKPPNTSSPPPPNTGEVTFRVVACAEKITDAMVDRGARAMQDAYRRDMGNSPNIQTFRKWTFAALDAALYVLQPTPEE